MKTNGLKIIFLSNIQLKVISITLSFCFWYIASSHRYITLQMSVPLSFDGMPEQYSIEAPETVLITLYAKRTDIYSLPHDSLAIHKNIEALLPGNYDILITKQDLFLPESIQLIDQTPSHTVITIKEL